MIVFIDPILSRKQTYFDEIQHQEPQLHNGTIMSTTNQSL